MNKFSDFAKEEPLDGEKIKIDKIADKEITVTAYRIMNSKFKDSKTGRCLKLQVEYKNKKYIVFTGSSVLIDQVEKYKEYIPFLTTITKIDKFYSFT